MVLLALVAMIDSVDRGILPGVLDQVQNSLHFSDFEAGFLGTAVVITGFLVVIPSGYIADRYRRTHIIAITLASWGVISAVNAAVQNYGQFLFVRATLGAGETVNNPSAQSLIADYYRPDLRGRAYSYQRVAPVAGLAIGTGIGGAVGSLLGWRWAFLLVGVPGSFLALAVWRLREPRRGEHDLADGTGQPTGREEAMVEAESAFVGGDVVPVDDGATLAEERRGIGAMRADVRRVLSVPTLRYLIVGTAIASGALAGIGFWGPTFFARHTSLTSGQASGVVAVLILIGAVAGTVLGGILTDRWRDRYEGAPMVIAGVSQLLGAVCLMIVFAPTPLAVKLPVSVVGVLLIVMGFPALTAMTSQVVPATIRGLSFSVTTFLTALVAAGSPLLIGAIADQFPFHVNGKVKGNLADAFMIVTPLVLVGALIVLRGRRHVAGDIRRAREANAAAPEPRDS
jgi:MFS family permease